MVVDLIRSKKYPNSVVFRDASWRFYATLLSEYDELPSRVNYDRGVLEVMTLSIEHERYKSMLGLMVGLLALTFRIPIANGGSSTLKRKLLRRGLEADQCYWVANESALRGKKPRPP